MPLSGCYARRTWLSWLPVLLLALMIVAGRTEAAPVEIDAARTSIDLAPGLTFLDETDADFRAEDVLAGHYDDRFQPSRGQPPSFVALRHPLWARVTLRNPTAAPLERLLVLKQTSVRNLTAYLPEERTGHYLSRVTDAAGLIRDTDGRYPHFVYHLTLPPGELRTLYLRVSSPNVKFFLSLEEPHGYDDDIRMMATLAGILFGFVLAVVAYQLALFLMARDPSYWSLVLFALCGLLYEFVKLGYHNMLLGGYAGLFALAWGVIQCLFASSVANFSRVFLRSRERFPRSDRALFLLQYGTLLTAAIYLMDPITGARLMQLSVALGAPLMLVTAVRAVLRGVDHSGAYLAGWVPVAAAGFYTSLSSAGLISSPTMEFMVVPAGVTLSLFIFAFAVANRIGAERMERHALRQERSRLTGILDASPVAVLVVRDEDKRIVFANRQASARFEDSPGGLAGSTMETVFDNPGDMPILVDEAHRLGEIRDHESVMRGAGELPFHGLISIVPTQFGAEPHLILWVYDISQRKEAEKQLLMAKQESDRANRAKSDFLAMISHEIRTPMNGILGMAQLLLRSKLDARQRMQMETLHKSGRAMLILLNDLLDLSRIEAGKLSLQRAPFSPLDVMDKVMSLKDHRAREKGLELKVVLDPGLPKQLLGDGNRFRQVLLNLVSNAIKFTDRGEVEVRMESTPVTEGQHRLVVSVRDTGCGIPESFHGELFDAFTRAPDQDALQREGSGLGLAICRRLVDAMGGTLSFESKPGRGSRFWFSLLLPEAEYDIGSTSENRPGATIPPRDILVVEDVEANQQVIPGMLELGGHRVTLANNGGEAVALARGHAYDVILMDLHMPVMDGLEATRAIRADVDGPCARTPIVAMTANLMEASVQSCLDAGMNHVLGKPIDLELLDEILGKLTDTEETEPRVQAPTSPQNEHLLDEPRLWRLLQPLSDEQREALLGRCRQALEDARRDLDEGLERQHWETIRGLAHQMTGVAGLYGFPRLARQAQALDEWEPPPEVAFEQVVPRVESLSLTLEQTVEALRSMSLDNDRNK